MGQDYREARGAGRRDAGATHSEGEDAIVHGTIEKFFHRSERWCAGKLTDSSTGRSISFNGSVFANEGDTVEIRGTWALHAQFGWQIKASSFSYARPVDNDALIEFLQRSPAFEGIGPARARALVAAAGDDFERALGAPELLAAKAGIPNHVVAAVRDEWFAKRDANLTMTELARYGITPGRAAKLYQRFGASVTQIVKENPYWLIGKVPGYGFGTVDKFALGAGISKTAPERLKHAVLHALGAQMGEGHTWTGSKTLESETLKLLMLDRVEDESLVWPTIDGLICSYDLVAQDIGGGSLAIWKAGMHAAEQSVVDRVSSFAGGMNADAGIEQMTTRGAMGLNPRLNETQALAVALGASSRVSVITGGAGTGKTYVINTLVAAFDARGQKVALCAPTGKAAKRMEQACGRQAKTIHRLLEPKLRGTEGRDRGSESDPDDEGEELVFAFGKDEKNPIVEDVVIVDEVSMVDIPLFAKLFRAIKWSKTQVVLVGDHNQLPPVGPGALLRDLVCSTAPPCPVVKLTQVVRQAGILKRDVSALLEGQVAPTTNGDMDKKRLGPWFRLDKYEGQGAVRAMLLKIMDGLATQLIEDQAAIVDETTGNVISEATYRHVDPVWDVQVLIPMHKYSIGVGDINVMLQEWAQRRLNREPPKAARSGGRPPIVEDDKVICTRNNYDLEVWNGSIGKVVARIAKNDEIPVKTAMRRTESKKASARAQADDLDSDDDVDETKPTIAKTGGLLIDFDGRVVFVTGEDLATIELAYAMTVHKSQGSEFPVSIFVCHKAHSFMLHRGLLYTAASRARNCSIILGDRYGWRSAASNVLSDQRRTMLSLRNAPGAAPAQIRSPFRPEPPPPPATLEPVH